MEIQGRYSYYDEKHNLQVPIVEIDGNTICSYVVDEGKWATKIAGLHGILRDLQEGRGIIDYLQYADGIPHIVAVSMFKAFVVQYARCYTDNSVRRLKLDVKDVFKPENIKSKLIHDEIIKMRMDYIAHASDKDYESGAMVLFLDPVVPNQEVVKILYANLKFMDPSELLESCLELCDFMIDYIQGRIEHFGKFYDEEIAKLDLEQVYSQAVLPNLNDCDILFEGDLMG